MKAGGGGRNTSRADHSVTKQQRSWSLPEIGWSSNKAISVLQWHGESRCCSGNSTVIKKNFPAILPTTTTTQSGGGTGIDTSLMPQISQYTHTVTANQSETESSSTVPWRITWQENTCQIEEKFTWNLEVTKKAINSSPWRHQHLSRVSNESLHNRHHNKIWGEDINKTKVRKILTGPGIESCRSNHTDLSSSSRWTGFFLELNNSHYYNEGGG